MDAKDSIYVQEVKQYLEIESSKIIENVTGNDTINVTIIYGSQKYKYGKWIFYYENGNKKSEGSFSLRGFVRCGNGPHIPFYDETRSGNWQYWEENGNPRTSLQNDENPGNGYFKCHNKDGKVVSEGTFKDGSIVDGKIYSYDLYDGHLKQINTYENGIDVSIDLFDK